MSSSFQQNSINPKGESMTEEIQPTVAAKPRKQDRTTLALLLAAALVAVGGIGFAAGRFTSPAAASTGNGNGNSAFGRGGAGRNFPSLAPGETLNAGQFGSGNRTGITGGSVTGTVQSVDSSSITLKLSNGSTVTIDLTGSTTYHSETAASADQVQTGGTVTIEIDTSALASETPNPGASGQAGRTLTAKDILITTP
jgi:hypothetical protein